MLSHLYAVRGIGSSHPYSLGTQTKTQSHKHGISLPICISIHAYINTQHFHSKIPTTTILMSLHYGFLWLSSLSRRARATVIVRASVRVLSAVSRLYGLVDENVATRNFASFFLCVCVSIVNTHHTCV